MPTISELSKLSVKQNKLFYEDKQISKWWGKTLFYFDKENKTLKYHNFSLLGLFLHLFGYKKEFNSSGLKDWLVDKKIEIITSPNENKATEKIVFQALKIFSDKQAQFSAWGTTEDTFIKLVEEGFDPNCIIDYTGKTAFFYACEKGFVKAAKLMIDRGANVNYMINKEWPVDNTPLHVSIKEKRYELTSLLLEHGADVNAKNNYGQTVLYKAIDHFLFEYPEIGMKKIIQAILDKNPNINETNDRGESPLYIACQKGNLEIIRLLVAKGADINEIGKSSPLKVAIDRRDLNTIKLLNDLGANYDIKINGQSPADYARSRNYDEIADFFDQLAK